jgi:hypothetical protein
VGFQFDPYCILQPDEDYVHLGLGAQERERSRHGDVRAMVPSHAIDCDRDIHLLWRLHVRAIQAGAMRGRHRKRPLGIPAQGRSVALGLDNFFAAIVAAGADVMAHMHLTGGWFHGEGRSGQKVVCAMHAAL